MGKHERSIVEEAEEITATLINNSPISSEQKNHPFINLIYKFVDYIKKEYPNICKAKAVGNTYKSLGDIVIYLDNLEKKYIELKFLEEKGSGTLANISQDALTSLGIFDCDSWSSYRKKMGHKNMVIDLLNKFNSENSKIKLTDADNKIHNKASDLKKIINVGNRNTEKVAKECLDLEKSSSKQILASKIILDIIKMDRKIKINYLNVLKKSSADLDRLKKFTFLLLTGNHTQEYLNIEIEKDVKMLKKNPDNYDVYYLYKKDLSIKKEDGLKKILSILSKDIAFDVKDDQTSLIIYSLVMKKRCDLIRVVFHWKNKFQGIKTPCLNIFKC